MNGLDPAIFDGKTTLVLDDIPNETYHATHWAVSSSMLKTLVTQTPAHYWAKYLDPDRDPPAQKEEWSLGSLFHSLVLEPDRDPARDFILYEPVDRRTKVGKAKWAELMEEVEGSSKQLLSTEGWETAHSMALAARKTPLIDRMFSGGKAEVTIIWRDPGTGLILKARPDYIMPMKAIADLKSCISAAPEDVAKAIYNWRYDIQNVHYIEGYEAAIGEPPQGFAFAFMEKSKPYAAAPYVLDGETLQLAKRAWLKALELLLRCMEQSQWPGYPEEITVVGAPEWAKRKMRESIDE